MMDVIDALTGRRSQYRLVAPAPGDQELFRLIEVAASAPDHGQLRPWRLVVQRGDTRVALGNAMAAGEGRKNGLREKPLRAPLLVAIVFSRATRSPIPEWEQLAATSSVVFSLSLALHAHGWGSVWRTGTVVNRAAVRDFMRLEKHEQLLGWLYIGTPEQGYQPPPRKPLDLSANVSVCTTADGWPGEWPVAEPAAREV